MGTALLLVTPNVANTRDRAWVRMSSSRHCTLSDLGSYKAIYLACSFPHQEQQEHSCWEVSLAFVNTRITKILKMGAGEDNSNGKVLLHKLQVLSLVLSTHRNKNKVVVHVCNPSSGSIREAETRILAFTVQ